MCSPAPTIDMLETIKPWLRAVKYDHLYRRAMRAAGRSGGGDELPDPAPVTFLLGCGRSGTTMLGDLFSRHPDVLYLFEPYHLWTAVDPHTDCLNLYQRDDCHCLMDETHCHDDLRVRFARTILAPLRRAGKRILVEKTPLNTLRVGYLEALAAQPRYVHIIRDGVDVCRSIARICASDSYRIAGRPTLHQWWGVDHMKWKMMQRDGIAAGHFPLESPHLEEDLARGAYEWLLSLIEMDRWRERLGDRLYEFKYEDLTADPRKVLAHAAGSMGLHPSEAWLDEAAGQVHPARRNTGEELRLPPAMCEAFNAYQERFNFSNRAAVRD